MGNQWSIFNEDAVSWAKNYTGNKFHALFTDAPYHLSSITERFGKKNSAPAKHGKDGVFSRSSRGFMGQQWDGGDIAFQKETWSAFLGVLHDGAFGMAFSASRNWHRMAVAIEDAGFIIHPTMFFLWVQGQGFPKSTKVKGRPEFEGYKYGLQALKPSVEPVILFQKPYDGRPIDNIVSNGAGVLNIDGTRIPLEDGDEYSINKFTDGMKPFGRGAGHSYTSKKVKNDSRLGGAGSWKTDKAAKTVYGGGYSGESVKSSPLGRYPSNLIMDEASAEAVERQKDGVSRFFKVVEDRLSESDPFYYCGKVMPKERNSGLEGFPFGSIRTNAPRVDEDTKNIPTKNPHPTLKPIELTTYLSKMLLPPDLYSPRKIFIPFSGVGSEMIGACLAGWDEVVGVEFDKENRYVEIAEARLEHWTKKSHPPNDF